VWIDREGDTVVFSLTADKQKARISLGRMRFRASTRQVEPAQDGTRVTLTTELRLRGRWRALEPLLAALYNRQLRGDLTRLKAFVETGG
jgi:hypothetical protein